MTKWEPYFPNEPYPRWEIEARGDPATGSREFRRRRVGGRAWKPGPPWAPEDGDDAEKSMPSYGVRFDKKKQTKMQEKLSKMSRRVQEGPREGVAVALRGPATGV